MKIDEHQLGNKHQAPENFECVQRQSDLDCRNRNCVELIRRFGLRLLRGLSFTCAGNSVFVKMSRTFQTCHRGIPTSKEKPRCVEKARAAHAFTRTRESVPDPAVVTPPYLPALYLRSIINEYINERTATKKARKNHSDITFTGRLYFPMSQTLLLPVPN